MFELPTAAEVAAETKSAAQERGIDRLVTCRGGKARALALAHLISDQMEDDEEWKDLLVDAPRALTHGVMSHDSFTHDCGSLQDEGLEDSRATDKECESDLDSFLPVWQEMIDDTIQAQLG